MKHIFGQFRLPLMPPQGARLKSASSRDTAAPLVEHSPDTKNARISIAVQTACEQFKRRMKELGRA